MVFVIEPNSGAANGDEGSLDVALVNNMPDAALHQTEVQFSRLLDAGAAGLPVRLWRYALPTIHRRPDAENHIRAHYLPLEALWESSPAAVIVTGCEPFSFDLTREPFWAELKRVLEWARERVASTIASCLAAHAALLAFDGVRRTRLPGKCSGVFAQDVSVVSPLSTGLGASVVMPHSRQNDVPTAAIVANGYQPLISSAAAGWTVGLKDDGRHLLVMMQGHPEYDADTLLLEFRRNLRRYVQGITPSFPDLPVGYFSAAAEATLVTLHDQATAHGPDVRLLEQFPMAELRSQVRNPWRQPAEQLYTNWLTEIRRRTMERVGV
jgi:homoserine O-succinyltransferase/O-acetyltransferase